MKLLTVSALLCALMALTSAGTLPSADNEEEGSTPTPTEESPPNASHCGNGWIHYKKRCFTILETPMTWTDAERNCLSLGGHLASVHDDGENNVIEELTALYNYPSTWIGGTDAAQDYFWFWSDGSPFRYSYWCSGEPSAGSGQHCLQINYSGAKCWKAEHCDARLPFICAKEM